MGLFKIDIDKLNNKADITLSGKFEQNDVEKFLKDFNDKTSNIKVSDYSLYFNAKDLHVSKQEMLPLLENCFKLYKQMNFKKIYMDMGDNAVLNMQIKRIARVTNLDNYELIKL